MKIGILSDTHAYLHPKITDFFANCDEIWHCGDIGNIKVLTQLQTLKPVRAVYGNIDGLEIRNQCKEIELFTIDSLPVCMMHIGGYPSHYDAKALRIIKEYKPNIFVCGHSHILRVMYDEKNNLLFINPGAAGVEGFHKVITCLRFDIENHTPKNMEIFETEKITKKI